MAEAEEIRSRIETIKDLSDRLAEQDRTIKDLEEEMRSETPEHPWSFMKMRRHNRLHTEIEDEQTSMSRDRYDLNHLAERLFEDVNIIADKATSTNSLELILDLVEQSLDTDPKYRENVRKQAGVTDGMSYMRLVPQDNPKGMLPPTPWGRKAAEEAYRQHQVRQLDQRLRLLRTLATGSYKNHDTPETNDYLALMDFNVGDHVTMGPGLSTTVTTPHWLGGGGILLIIEGASHGVPMVGSRGDVPNESEVFLPDLMHCTVLEEMTDGTYLGKRFERIYRLGIDSEETPVPKRELLEFPSIQSNVPKACTWPRSSTPRRPTVCSSNSRCSPTSRHKPRNRLRHSPGKPSRASDIILKKPRRKQGRESSDPVPVFCRISMKPKEHYLYD